MAIKFKLRHKHTISSQAVPHFQLDCLVDNQSQVPEKHPRFMLCLEGRSGMIPSDLRYVIKEKKTRNGSSDYMGVG